MARATPFFPEGGRGGSLSDNFRILYRGHFVSPPLLPELVDFSDQHVLARMRRARLHASRASKGHTARRVHPILWAARAGPAFRTRKRPQRARAAPMNAAARPPSTTSPNRPAGSPVTTAPWEATAATAATPPASASPRSPTWPATTVSTSGRATSAAAPTPPPAASMHLSALRAPPAAAAQSTTTAALAVAFPTTLPWATVAAIVAATTT